MKHTVLFVVNGLGMGNSTRCHAVIEHLHRAGVEVHVLTSGNGLFFFRECRQVASVTAMESFHYGKKGQKLSILHTFTHVWAMVRVYRNKVRQLERLLDELRPGLVVSDSEYAISPVRRRGVPLVGLNNSDVIVSEYLRLANRPGSIRGQFWCIEFMDYLFHRRSCDVVLSPAVELTPPRHPKFRRVGLIVRERVRNAVPRPHGRDEQPLVVFMLSGSTFSSRIDFSACDLPCRIEVVGREGASTDRVTYHGKLRNSVEKLVEADILVVNGGFSAVSEALVLRKPTLIIPVPRHAEQHINGVLAAKTGRCFVTSEEAVLLDLEALLEPAALAALDGPVVNGRGAEEAAAILVEMLGANAQPADEEPAVAASGE